MPQARVLCLLCEAVHTHWLRLIWTETVPRHLPYLRLCPWPVESITYRGACRQSPLRKAFHNVPHQLPKTEDEVRLAKNNYQKPRLENAIGRQRKAFYQKKKQLYGLSASERWEELGKIETPEQKAKRRQRRDQNLRYRYSYREVKAKADSKCSHCDTIGHNVRTCTQKGVGKPKRSFRCSKCHLAEHNILSCPQTKLAVEG